LACIKFVVVGASGSGKTCLINRYVDASYQVDTPATVGANYVPKQINLFGTKVKLSIWDLTGADHFDQLGPMFYSGAQVVVVVYDITQQGSFQKARKWVEEIKAAQGNRTVIALVGAKCDLYKDRKVDVQPVSTNYIAEKELVWTEVSAQADEGVKELFTDLAEKGLKKLIYSEEKPQQEMPTWVPDSCAVRCSSCLTLFSFSVRRHHCRKCGFLFCNLCSSGRVPLPACGKKPVRICDACMKVCCNQQSNKSIAK